MKKLIGFLAGLTIAFTGVTSFKAQEPTTAEAGWFYQDCIVGMCEYRGQVGYHSVFEVVLIDDESNKPNYWLTVNYVTQSMLSPYFSPWNVHVGDKVTVKKSLLNDTVYWIHVK